jgi:septum formation protein
LGPGDLRSREQITQGPGLVIPTCFTPMSQIVQPEEGKSISEILRGRRLVLASSSPRRAKILRDAGVDFEIRVPAGVEKEAPWSDPIKHVLALSRAKAESVARQVKEGIILGADTVVVLNGEILGKPKDEEDAFLILTRLGGKKHTVFTGITLVNKRGSRILSDYDSTQVEFNRLDRKKIESYVSTGEPMDKAGAYGIQGMGSFLVKGIRGSLDNVIGLPTEKLK